MLSKSVFIVISEVKITLKNPIWRPLFIPLFAWLKLLQIATKNRAKLTPECQKKIMSKFPTLVSELGKIPYFFFFKPSSRNQLKIHNKPKVLVTGLFTGSYIKSAPSDVWAHLCGPSPALGGRSVWWHPPGDGPCLAASRQRTHSPARARGTSSHQSPADLPSDTYIIAGCLIGYFLGYLIFLSRLLAATSQWGIVCSRVRTEHCHGTSPALHRQMQKYRGFEKCLKDITTY